MQDSATRPRWYEGLTARHWMVLAVASAGWVFDVYEGQLFTIFKTPMLTELAGGYPAAIEWQGNLGLAAFSARRRGRGAGIRRPRRPVRPGPHHGLHDPRLFLVLGTHGVCQHRRCKCWCCGFWSRWAPGASGRSPRPWWPRRFRLTSRAAASGIFHASSVLGGALASLTGMVFVGPGTWRWGFVMGLAPALLVLWIRVSMNEPDRWLAFPAGRARSRRGRAPGKSARTLRYRKPWRARAFLGLALATVGLATYWGIFAWGPELVGLIAGDTVSPAQRRRWGVGPTFS